MANQQRQRGPPAPPSPRCNGCIERGRTSKCDRQTPCRSCVNAGSVNKCVYGAPRSPSLSPPPDLVPQAPAGLRRPIDRPTPSNLSIHSSPAPQPHPPARPHPPAPPHTPRADKDAEPTMARAREKANKTLERELLKAHLAALASSDDECSPPTPQRESTVSYTQLRTPLPAHVTSPCCFILFQCVYVTPSPTSRPPCRPHIGLYIHTISLCATSLYMHIHTHIDPPHIIIIHTSI
ncbi:Reverse transcriptase [Ceratobasidium sp. AG-Ba]|nr:Reverse transcriptase [Ceratobasidium sp. AG-Ba]